MLAVMKVLSSFAGADVPCIDALPEVAFDEAGG
jgi:hypothetical protein